ncbi:hypothetical protein D3C80_2123110 [compost metagenome]
MTHQRFVISPLHRSSCFPFKPCDRLLQVLQQQRGSLFNLCRMHNPNALDHLANVGRLGWIRETLSDVPLRKGCQTLF